MCKMCRDVYPKTNINAPAAAGLFTKFWKPGQTITIAFDERISSVPDVHKDFVMNTSLIWTKYANLTFKYIDEVEEAMVRISFVPEWGAWSYVGTDCLQIPKGESTMNLGWLDQAVVLHEFGHMLGLIHEHQNPEEGVPWNEDAVYDYYAGPPNYWSHDDTYWNLLHKYGIDQIRGTVVDKDSIMMYAISNDLTIGDWETSWNYDLSELDKVFIGQIYPFETATLTPELALEFARKVYTKKRYLSRLPEDQIIEIGKLIDVPVDKSWLKKVNCQVVWDKIMSPTE